MNFTEEFRKSCNVLDNDFFVVDHFPSNTYLLAHILACVLNGILTITTTLLNATTLVTFWKSSQLRGKVSYCLIQVQSVIDLGLGILCNSTYTFVLISEVTETIQCEFFFALKKTTMLVIVFSMTTLSAMNFERYMGIVYPLVHRTKVTKKRLLLYIISMCSLYLIMFALSFVYLKTVETFTSGIIVLFLLTTVYIYAKIYRVATKAAADILQNDNASSHQNSAEKKRKQQFMKEITLAKSCFLVVVFSIICFLPPLLIDNLGTSGFDTLVYRTWGVTIAMANPSLNSAIFFWKNRKLREEAKKILKKYCNDSFKRQTQHIREPSITQISNVFVT